MKHTCLAVLTLVASGMLFSCAGNSVNRRISDHQTVRLPGYGIEFRLPAGWDLQFDDKQFFQFQAKVHDTDDFPIAFLEYRGLTTDPKSRQERAEYAKGWYIAIPRNFSQWEYTEKSTLSENNDLYALDGIFKEGEFRYRKIGKLIFRGNKIHAIYYTAPVDLFDEFETEFEQIDSDLRFIEP